MYVVTGANGNIGRRISEALLAERKQVRVISRDAKRLQPLATLGADVWASSLQDEELLTAAFEGATAVYVMIPPNPKSENLREYQNRIGEVIFTALKSARVKYIVNLSSLGGHRPDKTGPILGLYDQEQRLNWLQDVNLVHLRPTFFMENLLNNIPLIKTEGINGAPLKADLSFPVIATKDIARVASQYLLELTFEGIVVRELLGKRDISMNEMTKIIGRVINRDDLQYVQFPYDDAEKSMVESGFSLDFSRSLIELYTSINEGNITVGTQRSEQNTTETSFEEFAEYFERMYRAS